GPNPGLLNAPDPDGALRLIYAGRLTDSQKRASDVIRIVERLRPTALNYHVSVVGDGPLKGDFCRDLAPEIAPGRAVMTGRRGRVPSVLQSKECFGVTCTALRTRRTPPRPTAACRIRSFLLWGAAYHGTPFGCGG